MENNQSNNWYALYTKSRAEKKVLEQFTQLGIHAYLPLKRTLRQWSDRKKWVETPIINSYIFVNIPEHESRRVFEAHGVVAFVSHKGKPATIPDHEIEAMRRAIENQLEFNMEANRLEKGQVVTVTSGPLEGIKGEVLEVQGSKNYIYKSATSGTPW